MLSDSYLVARKKACKAEDTFDLNSEDGKRKISARRLSDSSSDSSSMIYTRLPKPSSLSAKIGRKLPEPLPVDAVAVERNTTPTPRRSNSSNIKNGPRSDTDRGKDY